MQAILKALDPITAGFSRFARKIRHLAHASLCALSNLPYHLGDTLFYLAVTFLCLCTFLYLMGVMGPSPELPRRLLAATAMATTLVVGFPKWRSPWLRTTIIALLVCVVLVAHIRISLIAYALACVFAMSEVPHLGLSLFITSMISLCSETLPILAVPVAWLSRAAALVTHDPHTTFGPTVLALGPFLVSGLFLIMSLRLSRRQPLILIGLLLLLLLEIAYLRMFLSQAFRGTGASAYSTSTLSNAALSMCGIAVVFGIPREKDPMEVRPRRMLVGIWFLVGLISSAILISPIFQSHPLHARVLFLNEGGLDWKRPRFGSYGPFEGGMFGLLPVYLAADGYDVRALREPTLTDDHFNLADILVTINNPRKWTDSERSVVRRFLQGGKSVLLLGDHTNVFGLMSGFNSLVDEYGIRFKFDSAYHLGKSWHGCSYVSLHPVAMFAGRRFDLSHSIGASLECRGDVQRFATAPYAFSDLGVPENVPGAFLGNYRYDSGEALGDIVLVATKQVGSGKLVVYGDTSAFQNGALTSTYGSHILPLFTWLARKGTVVEGPVGRGALAAMLLCVVGLAIGAREVLAFSVMTVFGVTFVLSLTALQYLGTAVSPSPTVDRETVLIDSSHIPWTGHFDAGMNSISPIYTIVARAGFRPLESHSLELKDIINARGVILCDPIKRLSNATVRDLLAYATRGGVIIVASGYEQRNGVLPLLQRLGLDITPISLGNVPGQSNRAIEAPRFLDAWPIAFIPTEASQGPHSPPVRERKVLYRSGEHVLALYCPYGNGGVVVISDSRFFSTRNIESLWGHWPGNVRFMYHIFKEILGAEPLVLEDYFPSFEKPR